MIRLDLHEARVMESVRQTEERLREVATEKGQMEDSMVVMKERLAELELAIEDIQWRRITQVSNWEFSRDGLTRIISLCRMMYLKNPMTRRSIDIQACYVWGQGVNISAKHPMVQEVIDDFISSEHNKVEIFSMAAYLNKEQELQMSGNLFFLFFSSPVTGDVRLRTIPVEEIVDIKTNPNDFKEPWFYKRVFNLGPPSGESVTLWYPAIDYFPKDRVDKIEGSEVRWDEPVYHIKVGGMYTMKFGVPEPYSSLDWAQAYKNFLEDWATIMRAYSRLAMQVSGVKGKGGAAAAKSRLATNINTNNSETNPSATTAAWFLTGKEVDVKAIKTAGATTSAEEGRPLKLMVAAGVGLPDTFFGDANVGNFATAKTLDRPTELKFLTRQKMWAEILTKIFIYVIMRSAKATNGKLNQAGANLDFTVDPVDSDREIPVLQMPVNDKEDWGKIGDQVSREVVVEFPSILERNVTDRVRAVVNAITLFGKELSDLIPDKRRCAKWLLQALGEPNPDKVVMELYPEGSDVKIEKKDPVVAPGLPGAKKGAEDAAQGGAVGDNG